jgi:hypothetical protein
LKINGEKLLQIEDDGAFLKWVFSPFFLVRHDLTDTALSLMRDYFATLGDSAHPDSTDPRARAITRFQELLLVSFREFSIVSDDTILAERRRLRAEVVHSIESFAKRAAVRNLRTLGRFSKDQAGLAYDALYRAMCIEPPPPATTAQKNLVTTSDGSTQAERAETRIGLRTFKVFISEIATWGRHEKVVRNGLTVCHTSHMNCGQMS